MIISEFTEPELNYFRKVCNFSPLELKLFDLRSQGITLDEIAEILNISRDWAGKISQKVNKKIIKVI